MALTGREGDTGSKLFLKKLAVNTMRSGCDNDPHHPRLSVKAIFLGTVICYVSFILICLLWVSFAIPLSNSPFRDLIKWFAFSHSVGILIYTIIPLLIGGFTLHISQSIQFPDIVFILALRVSRLNYSTQWFTAPPLFFMNGTIP